MLCYRDMTFCTFYCECADGATCHRALTDDVIAKAKNNAVCRFIERPTCFMPISQPQRVDEGREE